MTPSQHFEIRKLERRCQGLQHRVLALETFMQAFCALQLIAQNLLPATEEEKKGLETFVSETLESWKKEYPE